MIDLDFTCSNCGATVSSCSTCLTVACPSCGVVYDVSGFADPPSWTDIGIGIFIGALVIGPFIWAPLGRRLATTAVSRGAKVTREKVEEWIEKGKQA